jgi:HD-like signal output (HDOD) protein
MRTDWDLVRALMTSAIDACEAFEALDIQNHERDATSAKSPNPASVSDILTSAWVLPERLRYQIVHARHEAGLDAAYVPDTARVLVHMAQACAELIGARDAVPAADECRKAVQWYADHAVPLVHDTIAARRDPA